MKVESHHRVSASSSHGIYIVVAEVVVKFKGMHGHDLRLPAGHSEHGVHGVVGNDREDDLLKVKFTTLIDEPIMSEQH